MRSETRNTGFETRNVTSSFYNFFRKTEFLHCLVKKFGHKHTASVSEAVDDIMCLLSNHINVDLLLKTVFTLTSSEVSNISVCATGLHVFVVMLEELTFFATASRIAISGSCFCATGFSVFMSWN